MLAAVAVDPGGRGYRIAKERTRRRVDGCVALAFACLAARDEGGWADEPPVDEYGASAIFQPSYPTRRMR